jgi:hypothetical protein
VISGNLLQREQAKISLSQTDIVVEALPQFRPGYRGPSSFIHTIRMPVLADPPTGPLAEDGFPIARLQVLALVVVTWL